MFKHDLKIAWRNLLKYKQQTVISLLGLAVGLTSFVLCNDQLRDELMWNRRMPDVKHLYSLVTSNSDYDVYPLVDAGIARSIRDELPEINEAVFFFSLGGYSDKMCVVEQENGTQTWRKEFFLYTDSSFINFFGFKLLQGNWETVKKQPDAVVLTLAGARRIFGTTEVVGCTFTDVRDFDNTNDLYRVAAVMEDFPEQTDFESMAGVLLNPADKKTKSGHYQSHAEVLFKLRPGIHYEKVNEKIAIWLDKHPELKEQMNVPQKLCPYLEVKDSWRSESRWTFPLIFAGIGFLALLTAIFNYVLFMSGRILNRRKEYAIREISGAAPRMIFRMFAIEIILSVGMSVFVALLLLEVMSHLFTEGISSYFYFDDQSHWMAKLGVYLLEYALLVLGCMLMIAWVSLKKIRHVSLLRSLQDGGNVRHRSMVQNLLLGLQLMICMLLGGGAYFLYAQQLYLQQRMMGKLSLEECKRIYEFPLNGDKLEPIRADFQNMVNTNPYLEMAVRNGNSLLCPWSVSANYWSLDGLEKKENTRLFFMYTDANYPDFIHARMEEGRFFRENEMLSAVVNREFIRCWGINPLGKEIRFNYWQGVKSYHVVGIIEDILTSESEPKVVPCIYLPFDPVDPNWNFYVKLRSGVDPKVLKPLEDKMREQVNVFTPLWIKTLYDEIGSGIDYLREIGLLMGVLTLVCIVISLLGIYSSMMLAVERRSREMAIRKINGATLVDIARIFVRHYLWLLGGAAMIALPLLFLGVDVWLENYAYHFKLTPWPFVVIVALLLLVILLTIGSQLLKIIRINPSERLKSE